MKKLFTLSLSLISVAAMATGENDSASKQLDGKPAIMLKVFDVNPKMPTMLEDNKVSISKKHQLCWITVNMPVAEKERVTETFHTPAKTSFILANAQVNSSEDGKTHQLTTTLNSINKEAVGRCWGFEEKDPVGEYQLDIQIKDQQFNGLRFEVTK